MDGANGLYYIILLLLLREINEMTSKILEILRREFGMSFMR